MHCYIAPIKHNALECPKSWPQMESRCSNCPAKVEPEHEDEASAESEAGAARANVTVNWAFKCQVQFWATLALPIKGPFSLRCIKWDLLLHFAGCINCFSSRHSRLVAMVHWSSGQDNWPETQRRWPLSSPNRLAFGLLNNLGSPKSVSIRISLLAQPAAKPSWRTT